MSGRTRNRPRFGFIFEQADGVSRRVERAADVIRDELEAIGRCGYFRRAPFKRMGIGWVLAKPGKGRELEPCWTWFHKRRGNLAPHLTMCLTARHSRIRSMTDAEFAQDARHGTLVGLAAVAEKYGLDDSAVLRALNRPVRRPVGTAFETCPDGIVKPRQETREYEVHLHLPFGRGGLAEANLDWVMKLDDELYDAVERTKTATSMNQSVGAAGADFIINGKSSDALVHLMRRVLARHHLPRGSIMRLRLEQSGAEGRRISIRPNRQARR